jgi:hypothetical protein
MTQIALVGPGCSFPLPPEFDYDGYIEIERELWAFFPETEGRRVNFAQVGLIAQVYAEVPETGAELDVEETYFLMPCADQTMRPVRMRITRRLTISEYRMAHLTAVKLIGKVGEAVSVLVEVGKEILGQEVLEEFELRQKEWHPE